MTYKTIEFKVENNAAEIILARPDQANTLTPDLICELKDVVLKCRDDKDIRAVLFSASPGPFFSAGGDLQYFSKAGDTLPVRIEEMLEDFHPTMEILSNMDAPVVACVDGVAAGIGFSYVLNASYCFASPNASFCMAYTGAGLTPDGGASYFLPRIVGMRRAEELMLTNRTLSAEEAMGWGIVNQIIDPQKLHATALKFTQGLAKGPTLAFGNVRKLLLGSFDQELKSQLTMEGKSIAKMSGTKDGREGVAAFLEKRKPNFIGR